MFIFSVMKYKRYFQTNLVISQLIVDGRNLSEDSFGLSMHTVKISVNGMFSLFLYLFFSSIMLSRGGDSGLFAWSLISAGSFQHFTIKYDESAIVIYKYHLSDSGSLCLVLVCKEFYHK